MTKKIMINYLFSGWKTATEDEARTWSKSKLDKITTCKNDNEKLKLVNDKLSGIKFSLAQLK